MQNAITDEEIDDFLEENAYLEGHEPMVRKLHERFGAAAVNDNGELVPEFFYRLSERNDKKSDLERIAAMQRIIFPILSFLVFFLVLNGLGWVKVSPFLRDAGLWISAVGCAGMIIYSIWLATRDVGSRVIVRSLLLAAIFGAVAVFYKPDILLKIPKSPAAQNK